MVSIDRAEAVLERMETVNVTVAVPANETAGAAASQARPDSRCFACVAVPAVIQ